MGNPVYICKHGLNSPTKVIFIDGFPFSFAIFFLHLRVVSISLAENTSAFKAPFYKKGYPHTPQDFKKHPFSGVFHNCSVISSKKCFIYGNTNPGGEIGWK